MWTKLFWWKMIFKRQKSYLDNASKTFWLGEIPWWDGKGVSAPLRDKDSIILRGGSFPPPFPSIILTKYGTIDSNKIFSRPTKHEKENSLLRVTMKSIPWRRNFLVQRIPLSERPGNFGQKKGLHMWRSTFGKNFLGDACFGPSRVFWAFLGPFSIFIYLSKFQNALFLFFKKFPNNILRQSRKLKYISVLSETMVPDSWEAWNHFSKLT